MNEQKNAPAQQQQQNAPAQVVVAAAAQPAIAAAQPTVVLAAAQPVVAAAQPAVAADAAQNLVAAEAAQAAAAEARPVLPPAQPQAQPAAALAMPTRSAPLALTGTSQPAPAASSDLPSLTTLAIPTLILGLLAILAVWLGRKRKASPRLLQIIETVSLGPKRSLVIARVGDELLVLGSSEGGITLLATRPAQQQAAPGSESQAGDLARLRAGGGPGAALAMGRDRKPSFEEIFEENAADEELRRKLASGIGGRVP